MIDTHNIVSILHREQQWHQVQLDRINPALQTVRTQTSTGSPPRRVQWNDEILAIFREHEQATAFWPRDIINILTERGIPEAILPHRKINVYVTLRRLVERGLLEKSEKGQYRKTH